MKKNLNLLYESLEAEAISQINQLLEVVAVESKFCNQKIIVVPDGHEFNLDGGRYCVEFNDTILVDNEGHQYHLDTDILSLKQLCELVEAVKDVVFIF